MALGLERVGLMAMVVMRQSMPDPETVRPERVLIKWAERLKVRLREGGRERETCERWVIE